MRFSPIKIGHFGKPNILLILKVGKFLLLSFKDIKLCTEMHKYLYSQLQSSINTDFVICCFNGGILPIFFQQLRHLQEEKHHSCE